MKKIIGLINKLRKQIIDYYSNRDYALVIKLLVKTFKK